MKPGADRCRFIAVIFMAISCGFADKPYFGWGLLLISTVFILISERESE